MQYDAGLRDAQNDVIETDIGLSPILRIYNGPIPGNTSAPLVGTNKLLGQGVLPSDWLAASAGGVKVKAGSWTLAGQPDAGSGTPGTFFRIYKADGVTCKVQGTFGVGGEMVPDNNSIANGQAITVSAFGITRGNS